MEGPLLKPNRKALPRGSRQKKPTAVCLFASAGIGELGVQAAGIDILVANELDPLRASLYKENFTHTMIQGDIRHLHDEIILTATKELAGDDLFLLYATPPCQGMSSNGMGKLKAEVEAGRRKEEDERNRLVIPAMDIAVALKPQWVMLENVPGMEKTEIRTGRLRTENVIQYIKRRLGKDYVGKAEVVACEDYGIPQRRRRLLTIFTRNAEAKAQFLANGGTFFTAAMREPMRTLRDAIANFPPLDAKSGFNEARWFHPHQVVPIMSELKYHWVQNTREGDTAFNNQCINPKCLNQDNPGHADVKVDGKWVSSKTIPIYCDRCGELLPRPHVIENGLPRLLRGFHSAYRRMRWDEPARTLTQNFLYEASDNKIHPSQNRVLSVYEAMEIQSINKYDYCFTVSGRELSAPKIAEVIGESVPPYLIEKICRMMLSHSWGSVDLGCAGSLERRTKKNSKVELSV